MRITNFQGLQNGGIKFLLIPQHRSASDSYNIIAVDSISLDSVIHNQTLVASVYTTIYCDDNLQLVQDKIKRLIPPGADFGGFEAAVILKNTDSIFFTLETDSLCFVIRGIIENKINTWQVVFDTLNIMPLEKPDYLYGNAGFESIAYLENEKKLVAFYEKNVQTSAAAVYIFTTDLKNKMPVRFTSPLFFRLTDASDYNGDTLWELNHFYNDYKPNENCAQSIIQKNPKMSEFCYYIGSDTTDASLQMHDNDVHAAYYTRLIKLAYANNKISWNEETVISFSADNWEGLIPFENGVLMVVDGRPPGVPSKLSYFKLN